MGEFEGAAARLPEMTADEKKELCEKLRARIIETVLENGGHLASNLGVVELTVGLYSVLDPFTDRVIWDVGHQCYPHKLLTGREDSFGSLRTENGISGFPVSSESPADAFDTGHSSTSISAAIGFARAFRLTGQDRRVCAVVGDGAFGGGMIFEALNDAGRSDENVIVILNDNGMSISPNVGALSKYFQGIRTRKSYLRAKRDVKSFLDRIPGIGRFTVRQIERLKNMVRAAVIPDGVLFEELGWKYIGPIDGHSTKAVADSVKRAVSIGGPVLIHAVTTKGRGYAPAEEDPTKFHGVRPAQPSGGKQAVSSRSFSENLGKELCALAENDSRIVAVNAAMVDGTGLKCFAEKYPERYIDVGIAEEHAVTMCCALAKSGLRPFLSLYSTFAQRSYDQLLHDAALPGNPVVLCLDRGGVSGPDGRTHQGIYDLAYLGTMPGFTVCAPATLEEQSQALKLAAASGTPFAIRYPAKEALSRPPEAVSPCPLEYGRGTRIYTSASPKALIVAIGSEVWSAMDAAEILAAEGIGVNVFSARFMKPLDTDGIVSELSVPGIRACVTAEDGIKPGGFGESVLAAIAERGIRLPSFRIAAFPDEGIPHGPISSLLARYGLDGEGIAALVRLALADAGEIPGAAADGRGPEAAE